MVRVKYSSLNYKDSLSYSGNKGVTKIYPHTPGIDAMGIVEVSKTKEFDEGDKVIVTGYDLGMNTPGGFGEYIRVPKEWVTLLPDNLGDSESMILGTAGITAGLCINTLLEKHKIKGKKNASTTEKRIFFGGTFTEERMKLSGFFGIELFFLQF